MVKNKKIIFMGTPNFSVSTLEKIIQSQQYDILAVVTQPDRKVGRHQQLQESPIKKIAQKHHLPLLQPTKIKEIVSPIQNLKPDFIIVVAYGQILPKELVNSIKCVNVHASLLPKYRGASPIQGALLNDEKETGVTIMFMDEKMDTGPILAQRSIKIYNGDTADTLHDKLSQLGSNLLLETLNQELKPIPQDHSQATYTKIIKREDGQVNLEQSLEDIKNRYRAYYPWPGIFLFIQDKRLKLNQIEFSLEKPGLPVLACSNGYIILKKVQFEGKKEITGEEFQRGYSKLLL